jgi:hypothetical protein
MVLLRLYVQALQHRRREAGLDLLEVLGTGNKEKIGFFCVSDKKN